MAMNQTDPPESHGTDQKPATGTGLLGRVGGRAGISVKELLEEHARVSYAKERSPSRKERKK